MDCVCVRLCSCRHIGCWHTRIDFFRVASLRETFFLKPSEHHLEVFRVADQLAAINDFERLPEALRRPFPQGLPE